MGVVTNARINESRAAADAAAPVATNVHNDSLPDGGGLSMGVVVNGKINESRAASDAAAPAASSTINVPAASAT